LTAMTVSALVYSRLLSSHSTQIQLYAISATSSKDCHIRLGFCRYKGWITRMYWV